jgi:dihydroxyacetone kinase
MGIHGEPGIKKEKLQNADTITTRVTNTILDDLKPLSGDSLAVMINGLGATPLEELYIVYRKVHEILTMRTLNIHKTYIGEFATSMEMSGLSITLFKLDDELKLLLDAPAITPFFKQL